VMHQGKHFLVVLCLQCKMTFMGSEDTIKKKQIIFLHESKLERN
jgi:predicted nucleic-acid-binding Zn-ribbon protein